MCCARSLAQQVDLQVHFIRLAERRAQAHALGVSPHRGQPGRAGDTRAQDRGAGAAGRNGGGGAGGAVRNAGGGGAAGRNGGGGAGGGGGGRNAGRHGRPDASGVRGRAQRRGGPSDQDEADVGIAFISTEMGGRLR